MLQDMLASRYACLLVYASRYEVYACWFKLLLAGLCLKERHSEPQNCSQVAVIIKKNMFIASNLQLDTAKYHSH
jgi:hypothetical protein